MWVPLPDIKYSSRPVWNIPLAWIKCLVRAHTCAVSRFWWGPLPDKGLTKSHHQLGQRGSLRQRESYKDWEMNPPLETRCCLISNCLFRPINLLIVSILCLRQWYIEPINEIYLKILKCRRRGRAFDANWRYLRFTGFQICTTCSLLIPRDAKSFPHENFI